MPRLRLRHFVVLFAGLALAPRLATAQQAEPRTYTVKRGDTLWDIAKQYLGDAYLWPEIYRLNTATIEDPHWIYPNEVLILPGMGTIASTATVTPRRSSTMSLTRDAGTLSACDSAFALNPKGLCCPPTCWA